MLTRYLSAMVMASVVTFGLFFVMQLLVASGNANLSEDTGGKIIDMVRIDREEEILKKDREIEKPQEVEAPPPDIDIPQTRSLRPGSTNVSFNSASVEASGNISGGLLDCGD